jgi:DNA-binding GntR family transcriptional regulator
MSRWIAYGIVVATTAGPDAPAMSAAAIAITECRADGVKVTMRRANGSTSRNWRSPGEANTRRAYDALRERIGSGALAPGEWLREHVVATSLGLSRTPVREALRLLAAEGVVELMHNRGARVVRWTSEDIDEAYRLRALIEGYGAGLAARHADKDRVAALRVLQDRYERALEDGEPSGGAPAQCNDDFHAAVLAASGSARLSSLVATVSSAPLVRQVLRHYSDDDRRRSVLQHRDIITAIENRDEDLATSAMSSHILAARYSALRSDSRGER